MLRCVAAARASLLFGGAGLPLRCRQARSGCCDQEIDWLSLVGVDWDSAGQHTKSTVVTVRFQIRAKPTGMSSTRALCNTRAPRQSHAFLYNTPTQLQTRSWAHLNNVHSTLSRLLQACAHHSKTTGSYPRCARYFCTKGCAPAQGQSPGRHWSSTRHFCSRRMPRLLFPHGSSQQERPAHINSLL